MNKSVIIVGAGVGGLATAVKLLSKGYNVTIYEKNTRIGGRVNLIETDNFRFDLTASILMTPEIYKDVFRYVGKDYKDYINFNCRTVNWNVYSSKRFILLYWDFSRYWPMLITFLCWHRHWK